MSRNVGYPYPSRPPRKRRRSFDWSILAVIVWLIFALIILALNVALVVVAIHFITKYW